MKCALCIDYEWTDSWKRGVFVT